MRLHSDYIELVGVDVAVGVVADQSEVVENREEVMDETVGKNTSSTYFYFSKLHNRSLPRYTFANNCFCRRSCWWRARRGRSHNSGVADRAAGLLFYRNYIILHIYNLY